MSPARDMSAKCLGFSARCSLFGFLFSFYPTATTFPTFPAFLHSPTLIQRHSLTRINIQWPRYLCPFGRPIFTYISMQLIIMSEPVARVW